MARTRDGVITTAAWNSAKKACERAGSVAECNESGAGVTDGIDGDLTCKWTRYPDVMKDNRIEKRDVGGFLESVGSAFVGRENIQHATCHVSGRDHDILVN